MKALLTLHAALHGALIAVAATLLEVATCNHAIRYFKIIKNKGHHAGFCSSTAA